MRLVIRWLNELAVLKGNYLQEYKILTISIGE